MKVDYLPFLGMVSFHSYVKLSESIREYIFETTWQVPLGTRTFTNIAILRILRMVTALGESNSFPVSCAKLATNWVWCP